MKSTARFVTTKGNGNGIDVFALTPSAAPVVNADPGAVPFAVSFDAGGTWPWPRPGPTAWLPSPSATTGSSP